MFSAFSDNFYTMALAQGYRLDYWLGGTGGLSTGELGSDAAYLAFQKVDIATLICMHVVDTTQKDWKAVLERNDDHLKWAEGLLDRLQNIAIIYILAGEGPPPWLSERPSGFIEYHGQPAYSVFWWLDISTGAVTAPKGQPSQLFGLRGLIDRARMAAQDDDCHEPSSQGKAPSFKRRAISSLEPIHRVPILTFLILGVNIVIMLLMYMAGYQDDPWVPARFGAIVPEYIYEDGQWYRLFTAMFVHFGAAHLFTNGMGLMVFGARVERYFGRIAFCVIYLLAGLLGSLFSLIFTSGYAAGASGAIYGLIGAIFAYTRMTRRTIEHMNWYTLFLFIGVGLAMGFMTPGVDNFGHLGGLAGGVAIGVIMVGILRLKERK